MPELLNADIAKKKPVHLIREKERLGTMTGTQG